VHDDPANGLYRVSREIFTDPEIFEIEMKNIFEGNWIYLAHESQIPNKNATKPPIPVPSTAGRSTIPVSS
jgi:hypothetical protein